MDHFLILIAATGIFTIGYLIGAKNERDIWELEIQDIVDELTDEKRRQPLLNHITGSNVADDLIFRLDQNK